MLIHVGALRFASALVLPLLMASAAHAGIARADPRQANSPQADPAQVQSLYKEGERALAAGQYAEAERAYTRMRELQPNVAEVHARLGLIYFQQGRFADAVAPLQKALQLKPALPNVGALLAMSLSEIGRHEEALPGLEKAFHQSTDSALRRMAGLHLERSYTDLDRDRDAVAVALELTRLYPDDPEVLYHTGRLFGNYAYLQTVKLARVAPDSIWLHQAAGEANESQGLLNEAISHYRQVIALAPRRPGIHFRLGRVLLTQAGQAKGNPGAEAEALKEFQLELQVDPSNADAAYEIGEMMRKGGQLDKALASFKQAVAAYPSFEEALVGLGRTLVATGDPAAALPYLDKAITLNPSDEVAFYQLAQAHRALGQDAAQQKALAEFERLRAAKGSQAGAVPAGPSAVTKQEVDPESRPK
jgi:tetratricopeptide (TPR) repeat protein